MLGTAFPAGRLLLVEQPGPWGRLGLQQSRFDPQVAHDLIVRLDRQGVRVLAIRRPGRPQPSGDRHWGYVDCRGSDPHVRWGRFRDDVELLDLDLERPDDGPGPAGGAAADPAPLFAVCAHSTHDACCAIRGRPVAAALERLVPGRVWECSHVGGDRFAANVLVLPAGVLYGRVPVDAAADLVGHAARDEVIVDLLRGRVGFPPVVQAAMAGAHRHTGLRHATDIRPLRMRPAGDEAVDVDLDCAGRPLLVRVHRVRSAPYRMTCQAVMDSTAVEYRPEIIGAGVDDPVPVV